MARRHDTVTLYPLTWYWLGRGLLYLALIMLPLTAVAFVAQNIPAALQPAGEIFANVILLPALYGALYLLLRRMGARSQNFIILLVLLFAGLAYAQGARALAQGGTQHGMGAVLAAFYAAGFAWLAWHGHRRNRQDLIDNAVAEREAAIELQAEAILRARAIEARTGSKA